MTINKPEVVAWRWRKPVVNNQGETVGTSTWELSDAPEFLPWWTNDPLIRLSDYEALAVEYDRLTRYYKNGIDCFANPCEEHSGERTPPFAEFFEKYGGRCLICLVDNNKAMKAECEALVEALEKYESAFEELFSQCFSNPITNAWGKTVSVAALNDAHAFASSCLAAHRKKGGEA